MRYRLLFRNFLFFMVVVLLLLCSSRDNTIVSSANSIYFSHNEIYEMNDETAQMTNFYERGFVNDELLNIQREDSLLRTIVYPDDESDAFSNAELITLDTNISRMYNDLNDYDYFFIGAIFEDKTLVCDCDINSYLSIYQYYTIIEGNIIHHCINKVMFFSNISTSNKIYLMAGFSYYFVFTQYGNYTGEYNFTLEEVNLDFDEYIMKTEYSSNGLFDKYELLHYDYSIYNNQGSRYGYVPADADIGIPNMGTASTNNHCYFDISTY